MGLYNFIPLVMLIVLTTLNNYKIDWWRHIRVCCMV